MWIVKTRRQSERRCMRLVVWIRNLHGIAGRLCLRFVAVSVVDSAQALDQGHASAAWALISAKADKSLKDNKGHTALMLGNLVSPVLSWIAMGLTQAAVGLLRACRSQDGCGNARVPRAKLSLGGRCLRMLWQRQELGPQNAHL